MVANHRCRTSDGRIMRASLLEGIYSMRSEQLLIDS